MVANRRWRSWSQTWHGRVHPPRLVRGDEQRRAGVGAGGDGAHRCSKRGGVAVGVKVQQREGWRGAPPACPHATALHPERPAAPSPLMKRCMEVTPGAPAVEGSNVSSVQESKESSSPCEPPSLPLPSATAASGSSLPPQPAPAPPLPSSLVVAASALLKVKETCSGIWVWVMRRIDHLRRKIAGRQAATAGAAHL